MNGKKIKIALCLSGEPRSSMFCFPYIYESFINLGQQYQVDTYIHTRKTFRAFYLYKPKKYILDNVTPPSLINLFNSLDIPPELIEDTRIIGNTTIYSSHIFNQLLMIDGIYNSFNLTLAEPNPYDIYVRCRFDVTTPLKFNFKNIINNILSKKYDLFIPSKIFTDYQDIETYKPQYNDQLAIGNYKAMEIYSNMINNLPFLLNQTLSWKAENWLPKQLDVPNIKVKQYPLEYSLVRNVKISSNKFLSEPNDLSFLDE